MRNNTRTLRLSIWCLACGLALLFAMPDTARADEGDELTAQQKRKARKLIKQAKSHKKAAARLAKRRGKKNKRRAKARYHKAAAAYLAAYAIVEMAPLLIELGQVYQARGELPWALRTFKKYLEQEPEGALVDDAESAIAEIETAIAEAKLKDQEMPEGDAKIDPMDVLGPEPEPEPIVEEPEPEEPEETGKPELTEQPETRQVTGKSGQKKSGRLFFWSGVGAATVGAALIGTGIGFGVSAQSAADTLSANDDAWNDDDRALIDSGRSSQTKMYIFTSIGAAALAGGAALVYLGLTADSGGGDNSSESATILAPSITPERATLTVMGRF